MGQADSALGVVVTPTFDRSITQTNQIQAQFWEQNRLHRELAATTNPKQPEGRKKNAKKDVDGKGKGDGKGVWSL